MSDNKATRLSKIAREYNVGISTIVEFLHKKGHNIDPNPNTKIAQELCDLLVQEYSSDLSDKKKSESFSLKNLREKKETVSLDDVKAPVESEEEKEFFIKDSSSASPARTEPKVEERPKKEMDIKVVGKVDLDAVSGKKKVAPKTPAEAEPEAAPPVKAQKPAEAEKEAPVEEKKAQPEIKEEPKKEPKAPEKEIKIVGKIDLNQFSPKSKSKKTAAAKEIPAEKTPEPPREEAPVEEIPEPIMDEVEEFIEPEIEEEIVAPIIPIDENMIPTRREKLQGPTVVGRIELPVEKDHRRKPVASSKGGVEPDKKKKRKRIRKETERVDVVKDTAPKPGDAAAKKDLGKKKKKKLHRPEVNEEDVQKQIKDTLAKLTTKGKSKGSKYRREKRDIFSQKAQAEHDRLEEEKNIVKVTEFVSASELATMMNVPVNEVIQVCMSLGLMVSINQRLDAETLSIVAEEFNYKVEFVSADIDDDLSKSKMTRPPLNPVHPLLLLWDTWITGKPNCSILSGIPCY
jgi:translation initiation factor IF-2